MTLPQWIIFGTLGLTLILFITGRWRYDVVALLALLSVTLTGLTPPERAFSGFSNPAVITVAAVLMAPIGISVAHGLGVSVDPFLMAITIGASCAFLTPIGHQSNTLVMGPGGYEFGDYWRMGLLLEVIVALTAIPLILIFWPL